jgi:rifampicin phosphotransferase
MRDMNRFTPPGPGVWERESVHTMRPISRAHAAIFPDAVNAGFRWGMKRYGFLLEGMEFQVVNRYLYTCLRPVGAPKGAKGPPPKLILKLMLLLHPEMRRRVRRIREVWATKAWREDVARWDNEWKPQIFRENTELQRVDVAALDRDAFISHLERCYDAASRSVYRHHSLNGTALLPLGDFLVHVKAWTGLPPCEVLPLFRGSSRVSQGAAAELDALVTAMQISPDAMLLLAGSDPAAVLEALTARTDAVGKTARDYVDSAGIRIATGYDFADVSLAEMPELLVGNIRSAVTGGSGTTENDVARREAALRDLVPPEHRQQFDELLVEARYTYRIRDERAYLNDAWACGIARKAILEAGRRLVAAGKLHQADHAVELTPSEIVSMLRGGNDRTADEAAADVLYRTSHTIHDAPEHLGGTPAGPPPPEWLPPDAARAERAIGIVLGEMFVTRATQKGDVTVSGFAASPGEIVGTARLVLDPHDMGRIQKGDVLITRATAPSYNALLPLLSGIVTDRGGTLSHAAVVAREYGIPAVVGCGNATELIKDGMRVRVNGATGAVEILA